MKTSEHDCAIIVKLKMKLGTFNIHNGGERTKCPLDVMPPDKMPQNRIKCILTVEERYTKSL